MVCFEITHIVAYLHVKLCFFCLRFFSQKWFVHNNVKYVFLFYFISTFFTKILFMTKFFFCFLCFGCKTKFRAWFLIHLLSYFYRIVAEKLITNFKNMVLWNSKLIAWSTFSMGVIYFVSQEKRWWWHNLWK